MYAIIETSGRQYRVTPGETIIVDRRGEDEGAEVVFDSVLLVSDEALEVGNPTVAGASVKAKVVGHGKGDKVITFKYSRRKRTRRRVGFRASQTTLEIVSIDR